MLSDQLMSKQKSDNLTLHSAAAFFSSGLDKEINAARTQVVNLHWVCGNMLSVKDIGLIRKPLVWTMHDMWPFCGAEHYADDAPGARFEVGYNRANRPFGNSRLDVDRWVWKNKCKAWRKPMHIVTPSSWLAECARRSVLMRDWPITVIANPLDTHVYQPRSKLFARKSFDLPEDKTLIAFGAIGGGLDSRKGFGMLLAALKLVADDNKDFACVVFGQSEPKIVPDIGLPIYWMGHLNDDLSLSLLYSAVDVMVVPSLQENLPQSGTEAQACGCPVVAFNCTGLPDIVEHMVTGYLAEAYSISDLASGINWVVKDNERHAQLSRSARERALNLWSEKVVIPQYMKVYQDAIDGQ
jgi:glycosyltransferase involved in cell wall biosynthesis